MKSFFKVYSDKTVNTRSFGTEKSSLNTKSQNLCLKKMAQIPQTSSEAKRRL